MVETCLIELLPNSCCLSIYYYMVRLFKIIISKRMISLSNSMVWFFAIKLSSFNNKRLLLTSLECINYLIK